MLQKRSCTILLLLLEEEEEEEEEKEEEITILQTPETDSLLNHVLVICMRKCLGSFRISAQMW